MNINIPCRELNMVKRYAMMTVLSLIYMSPNAQVSPNRQSRAIAPITQDLLGETKKKKRRRRKGLSFSSTKGGTRLEQEDFACSFSKKKTAYQNELQGVLSSSWMQFTNLQA